MKVTVVTGFPDFFRSFLSTSIVGRAVENKLIEINIVDIRDYGQGPYKKVDDYTFGGGGGMVMMAEPLERALEDLGDNLHVVYPSPQGVSLTQEIVESLSLKEHLVIICGHYEGIDERFVKDSVDLELSVGDYVLTGGELPAMIVIDAVSRLTPGVVGKGKAVEEDSFYRGMLDNSHFTRPSVWRDMEVPEVLLSGHTARIESWRRKDAVNRTLSRRPDLLSRASIHPYLESGCYILWHLPGRLDDSIFQDIKNTGLSCRVFGIKKLLLVIPDPSQRDRVRDSLRDSDEVDIVKIMPSLDRARQWITKKEKSSPYSIKMSSSVEEESLSWLEVKRDLLKSSGPALFVFGDEQEPLSLKCDVVMRPLMGGKVDDKQLETYSTISIVLDRFFGWR